MHQGQFDFIKSRHAVSPTSTASPRRSASHHPHPNATPMPSISSARTPQLTIVSTLATGAHAPAAPSCQSTNGHSAQSSALGRPVHTSPCTSRSSPSSASPRPHGLPVKRRQAAHHTCLAARSASWPTTSASSPRGHRRRSVGAAPVAVSRACSA